MCVSFPKDKNYFTITTKKISLDELYTPAEFFISFLEDRGYNIIQTRFCNIHLKDDNMLVHLYYFSKSEFNIRIYDLSSTDERDCDNYQYLYPVIDINFHDSPENILSLLQKTLDENNIHTTGANIKG